MGLAWNGSRIEMTFTTEGRRENWHWKKGRLEKELAAHSNILAWRIPGMGEPGGLPSVGSHGV